MRNVGCISWFVIVFFVLAAGFIGWKAQNEVDYGILTDRYSDDPLKYEALGPPGFYRLTFRATVDGAPVEIIRVGECRPYLASGGMGGGYSLSYMLMPPYAGQRLADGSAFYIKMPNYCFLLIGMKSLERWRAIGTEEVHPQAFWVDSLEEPNLYEAYITAAYFEQPESRVKIEEGRVEFLAARPEKMPYGGAADVALEKLRRAGVNLVSSVGWRMIPANPELLNALPAQAAAISVRGRFKIFDITDIVGTRGHFKVTGKPDEASMKYFSADASGRYIHKLIAGLPLDMPEKLLGNSSERDKELIRIGGKLYGAMMPLRKIGDRRYAIRLRPRGFGVWQASMPADPLSNSGIVRFIIDGDPIDIDLTSLSAYRLAFLDTQDRQLYVLNH